MSMDEKKAKKHTKAKSKATPQDMWPSFTPYTEDDVIGWTVGMVSEY